MTIADNVRKGYHDLLRREILELIPPNTKSLLDLGCGAGNLGKAVKQRQTCLVHGIELSRGASEIAARNIDHVWTDNLNRFDPAFLKQKYGVLLFADILEHLINPWAILKKFVNVLDDGGSIIASIPNVGNPWIVSNLQKGLFRYEPAGILDITHLRFFTQTSIFQMFVKSGLKVTKFRPWPSAENPIQYHITAIKAAPPHANPETTIFILTHNGYEYTKKCIDSIKRNTRASYKIVVIDNASTDNTINELRKDKTIYHIENTVNLGFSKGFNIGLVDVDTPYFVLANNDTVVTDGWLSTMKYHLTEDKDLMLLGPRSNNVSGPQRIKDIPYNDEKTLAVYAKTLRKPTPNPITYYPRIVFFFALFKKDVLRKVGLLDEIFGKGNYEDDDYCLRVAALKLKSAYDNTVFIHHYGSIGFKKNIEEYRALMATNRKKFMRKWHLTQYLGRDMDGAP